MSDLANRKYVFRRRPVWGRVTLGVLALGGTIFMLTFKSADAIPGGYQRITSIEEPAK
ncbi:hypothetical protein [Parvularcula lutaonensis]|uniref:Uncharacterized protein n=1 Tax=Parvularcula lutaonensis TaxID=491923 RepID=A0ABV7MDM0_9PROT|nr:hypothetical protein [Parvularcula lutaonensis]GGY53528.1 hypothetical protein GCM10007148_23480 [Parvularcula lutaonensis]